MAMDIGVKDAKRSEDFLVWPDDIIVDPNSNGRYSKVKASDDDVKDLAEKILKQGQLQSVGCRRSADKKLYLAFGFRRWTAIKHINEKLQPENPLRIRVRVFDGNELDAFERNITENRDRKATSVLDDAHNQKIFRDRFQWDEEKIAAFYGCTVAYLGQLSQILLLAAPVKKAIQDGRLAPTAALKMAQQGLSEEDQIALLKKLEIDDDGQGVATEGKKKKKKASTSQVEEGIREQRESAGGVGPSRKVKHVKKFFSEIIECVDEPESIKSFSEVLLDWLAGKKSDKSLSNAIKKLVG